MGEDLLHRYPPAAWPLIGFFATLPWGNTELPGGVQVVHLTAVTAVALTALSMLWGAHGVCIERVQRARWCVTAVGVFCTVQLIAALLSLDPARSLRSTAAVWIGAGVFIAVLLLGSRSVIRACLAAVVFSSAVVTLPVMLGTEALSARFGGTIVNGRPTGIFSDPNELGSYAAMMSILALGAFCVWSQRSTRSVVAIAGFAAAGCAALTLSRGAWIGAVLGVVCLSVLYKPARRVIGWGAVAGAAGVVVLTLWAPVGALSVVQDRIGTLSDPGANPYDVRDITYTQALTEFTHHPVWGAGPSTFASLSGGSGSYLQFYPRQHAHNGVLTLAVESGIMGVLSGAAVAGVLVWSVWQMRQRSEVTPEIATTLSALAVLSGHLLVDYTLRNPVLLLLAWCVFALSFACVAENMRLLHRSSSDTSAERSSA